MIEQREKWNPITICIPFSITFLNHVKIIENNTRTTSKRQLTIKTLKMTTNYMFLQTRKFDSLDLLH